MNDEIGMSCMVEYDERKKQLAYKLPVSYIILFL